MSEMSDPKPKKEKVRINQSLDADLHRRLKIRAAEEGIALQTLIESLLRQAADQQKRAVYA